MLLSITLASLRAIIGGNEELPTKEEVIHDLIFLLPLYKEVAEVHKTSDASGL